MALSNTLREPRRELTETAVGVLVTFAVAVPVLGPAYLFAIWFQGVTGGWTDGCPWPAGVVLGLLVEFVAFLLLLLVHFIGEETCDVLEGRGVRLRPRRCE